ncbi:MAG: hypothetical protein Q7T48_17130 [Cellvibrio sp.]|uniref:hypothetical protein n=1 Tax=Cellvibrio sp. TaxID=1965322 RepID=UPI00271A3E6B|nr:hypothetical protein [Cellvibrio sp.]
MATADLYTGEQGEDGITSNTALIRQAGSSPVLGVIVTEKTIGNASDGMHYIAVETALLGIFLMMVKLEITKGWLRAYCFFTLWSPAATQGQQSNG